MKVTTKLLAFSKPITSTAEHVHPAVLRTCNAIENSRGLLDTNIHFTAVHAASDKQFKI